MEVCFIPERTVIGLVTSQGKQRLYACKSSSIKLTLKIHKCNSKKNGGLRTIIAEYLLIKLFIVTLYASDL